MSENSFDFIILGAGLSGLTLAQALRTHIPQASVKILEKSRGLGGRLATRRTENSRFDHGAPWLRHQEWTLLSPQFGTPDFLHALTVSSQNEVLCGNEGMTSIAKALALKLEVARETRATRVVVEKNTRWKIETNQNLTYDCSTLILSAPVPQALELLSSSRISFPNELESISYEKAIVLLFEGEAFPNANHFMEFESGPVLTLLNQQIKGISPKPAWVMVMSPSFSESHFEEPDAEIENAALNVIKSQFPTYTGITPEVKKWRYSRTPKPFPSGFIQIHSNPDLFLIGDGFRPSPNLDPGIECALGSASALSEHLRNRSGAKHNPPPHL